MSNIFDSIFQDDKLSPRDKTILKELKKLGIDTNKITINNDGSVDVDGDVIIQRKELEKLPVQFGTINGNFDCCINFLKNLEGAPYHVKGYFAASDNELTTLKGSPKFVGGNYHCQRNKLKNLEHIAEEIGGNLYSGQNNIDTLEYFPKKVCGDVDVRWNKTNNIDTLKDFDFNQLLITNEHDDYKFYKGKSIKQSISEKDTGNERRKVKVWNFTVTQNEKGQ